MHRVGENKSLRTPRALTGELTAREREAFERALATDDALRAEWEHLQKVSGLLQESRADSFRPFFAARAAQRIKSQREESLTDALVWLFRPLAPVALVLVAFLALSNWNERELVGDDASFFAAIFAAVPATAEAAYVMDM